MRSSSVGVIMSLFDQQYYYEFNPDVLAADVPALEHFFNYGYLEGRKFKSHVDMIYEVQAFKKEFEGRNYIDFERYISEKYSMEARNATRLSLLRDFVSEKHEVSDLNTFVNKTYSAFSPNLIPYSFLLSSNRKKRISLIVPELSDAVIYGGIKTALDFFEAIIERFGTSFDYRIICQNEDPSGSAVGDLQQRHGFTVSHSECDDERGITSGKNRSIQKTSLRPSEMFITTFWATSLALQKGLHDNKEQDATICHFLQDYEPNFYPAGVMQQLAIESLLSPLNKFFVCNSQSLLDHVESILDLPATCIAFTPRIHRKLRSIARRDRANVLLFYARRNTRNLYEIGLMALQRFCAEHPELAAKFEFLGVGDIRGVVELSATISLNLIGKLTIEQYSYWLSKSSVGLSLMSAPHPSYPPLEMAYSGLRVITNDFGNKRMCGVHPNIVSVKTPSIKELSESIYAQCSLACEKSLQSNLPFSGFLQDFESSTCPFEPIFSQPKFKSLLGVI